MPLIDAYTLLGSWPLSERDLTLEDLAAGMQARGIARSLVTHTSAIFYDPPIGNALAQSLAAQHAQLSPVAVIDPLRYPACLDEIARCLGAGIRIFRLCPREHGYPFSGSVGPLREVLSRLDQARLLLVDLAELSVPIITPDIVELLPAPTAFTVDNRGLGTLVHAAHLNPRVWAETSRLDGGSAVQLAVQHLGAERVVFGSAAPLLSVGSAVMSVQYAEISEGDRVLVFAGNIARALA